MQVAPLFDGFLFQIVKAADKFFVGAFEGVFGVDVVEACGVDEAEKQVAKFGFHAVVVVVVYFGLKFGYLLFHFVPHLCTFFPIEADVAGFVLYAVGFDECRQCCGNAAQYRFVAVFFFGFKLFPILFDGFGGFGFHVAVDVRVAVDEFFDQCVAYVFDVEIARFAAHLGVEYDVQQHIAQLFFDVLFYFYCRFILFTLIAYSFLLAYFFY